ncbi:MAG: hypothetical protein JWL64_1516 [Frankiales bacterium]|nr:hypothetical protein [Frankiales bacterium]
MSYADKLLSDDERVVLDLRQHAKALIRPVLVVLVLVAAAVAGVVLVDDSTADLVIPAVAALAILLLAAKPILTWYFSHYVVTDRRVMVRSGVLARSGRDVPLSRINDIHFEHSVLERVLGCGTLVIESAGERGQVVLVDVPRVQRVQRTIYELVEDTDDRLAGREPNGY